MMANFTIENIQTKHTLTSNEKNEIITHCNKHNVEPIVDGVYSNLNYQFSYFSDVYSMNKYQTKASLKENKAYFCELSNGKVIELKG